MRDEFLSLDWANEHGKLTGALHRLIASIGESFSVLQHHYFDAPWRRKP